MTPEALDKAVADMRKVLPLVVAEIERRTPLDVQRLAVALDNVDQTLERGWTPAHYARAIATEYDRLIPSKKVAQRESGVGE